MVMKNVKIGQTVVLRDGIVHQIALAKVSLIVEMAFLMMVIIVEPLVIIHVQMGSLLIVMITAPRPIIRISLTAMVME